MKKNTLLISALAASGLLAVWWFILRKTPNADTTTDLGTALNSTTTTSTATNTTDNADILTQTVGQLSSVISGLSDKVQSVANRWIKTKGDTANTWTNASTGQQQTLAKGHNPNKPDTLTATDQGLLATLENESPA